MALIAMASFTATRLLLLILSAPEADLSPLSIPGVFLIGAVYDLAFYAYALIPVTLYLLLLPNRLWRSLPNRLLVHALCFATIYGLGFIAVSEVLFWDEFSVRFNFISVDYLVYRQEVTNNIQESYPVPWLLSGILLVSLLVYYKVWPKIDRLLACAEPFRVRLGLTALALTLPLLAFFYLDQDLKAFSSNSFQNELAGNGPYQFIAAFKNNDLDYYKFYRTLPDNEASALLKRELGLPEADAEHGDLFNIERQIVAEGPERRMNVFLIMVESLSAEFLGTFGNTQGLTPNLDALSKESMLFTGLYATGTRTTRGLEAVTLSIPPTPGRSIVKRIGHESNMWSLGNVLGKKGYDVRFLYGGRGYFDNMNAFFQGNGYQVMDQSSTPDEEMLFTNAWGMSDEDLYRLALRAADDAHQKERPFFFHLMTTSNHRPYTYPDGRVDIPSGSGREGAVKYTDWAIGDLISKAKEKPWFKDTLFVIVADHCASSAGRVALPINKYRIPMLIYSPGNIAPQRVEKLVSQIDVAPTLLGLMNMSYTSRFFGKDILTMAPEEERALIGNYQLLGLYSQDQLAILSPKKLMHLQIHPGSDTAEVREIDNPDDNLRRDIAYYQGASYIYKHQLNAWKKHDPAEVAN